MQNKINFRPGIWGIAPEYLDAFWSQWERVRAYRADKDVRAQFETSRPEMPGLLQKIGSIGVIHISGVMMKGVDPFDAWMGGVVDTNEVSAAVDAALADPDIKAVVLVVNSPGGSADGIPDLSDKVKSLADAKTLIAQVDGMAASAAYWVASQASKIYSNQLDMIGSIGVKMVLYDESKAFEQAGIKPVIIDTGEFKSAGTPGTAITDSQKADFQKIVDQYFAAFVVAVKRARADIDLKETTTGKVYLAQEAKKLGLIDGIQSLSDTLESANKKFNSQKNSRDRLKARLRIAEVEASFNSDNPKPKVNEGGTK